MSVVLRGARRFEDPSEPLDIALADGKISAVGRAGTLSGDDVRDVAGLLALPGLIDAHVHPIHGETFASVGSAAVFGGITTVCNHLYPAPDESYDAALDRMTAEAADGTADFAAHVRWDRTRDTEDLGALARRGGLSVKVFLAHPDKAIQAELSDLVTAMRQTASAGIPTVVHAELGSAVDRLLDLGYADRSDLAGMHAWRSTGIEAAAVTAAAALAKATGAHLYVVHVSCADAMRACLRARAEGVRISIETCPHYLFLTHETGPRGGQGFVLPPLRTDADLAEVRRALVDGHVDTVGSDHCGHRAELKKPEIAGSMAGLPGLELMAPLLIDAALRPDAWLPRHRVTSVLATGPARVFGLADKGALAPGYDADVVLVDPAATTTVSRDMLHDASAYTPYAGIELTGGVAQVWRRGELVVSSGKAAATGGGRFVGRR